MSADCEATGAPDAPAWLEVLSLISTAITTLFLVEIPLTLWSLGPEFYKPNGRIPHASLHLFDALIVVTTFVLEVVLRGKERELAGLLITLRLWRLLKLVGGEQLYHIEKNTVAIPSAGVAVGAGEIQEDTLKELAKVKRELEESRSTLVQTREENQDLRARVTWLESQTQSG